MQMDIGAEDGFQDDPAEAVSTKQYTVTAFSASKLSEIAKDAKFFLENTNLKYATRVTIFNEIRMVKIEFGINCLEMSPVAVEALGLTYDSMLSLNLIYNPDVNFV